MDKKPYYRLLGLTEGATREQIKAAYEKKMHKLRSEDYADDPEYVARKTQQVRSAYSVLMGGTAPATRAQKEARFEKWKDVQDGGEGGFRELKQKIRVGVSRLQAAEHEAVCDLDEEAEEKGSRVFQYSKKKTYYAPHEQGAKKKAGGSLRNELIAFAVTIVVGTGVLGSCVEMLESSFDGTREPDWDAADTAVSMEDLEEQVSSIRENAGTLDFDGWLEYSVQEDNQDLVRTDEEESMDNLIWSDMQEIGGALGLDAIPETVGYIAGDMDYYWDHSDLENAQMLVSVLNPPEFDAVAGVQNLYTDELILDYDSYLRFLLDVVYGQMNLS